MILRGFIISELEGEATNLDTQVAERLYICIYTTMQVAGGNGSVVVSNACTLVDVLVGT